MLNYTPTRQQAFNASAAHLLAQGKPSGDVSPEGRFNCTYGGSGCALRPFAPDDRLKLAQWDNMGGIAEIPEDWLPEYIAEDLDFYSALQYTHDNPATSGAPEQWLAGWIERMHRLAATYNLNPAILEAPDART